MKSPQFVTLWGDHRVAPCDAAAYELHHPLVGTVTVTQQTLAIARSPEQALVVCTTPAGSSSEEALALLRQTSAALAPSRLAVACQRPCEGHLGGICLRR
ncbi:hypothetical protein WN984_07485 [Streptomyces noursei]|nr:hypothetical protein [Streptomyces noursei]